jgi:AP-3 complex subunit delta-1
VLTVKYLGLLALHNIMKVHPKAVTEHRDLITWCLDDEDVSIRLRALDLLVGMVTKKNLMELVRKLMEKLEKADGNYREELMEKIILICSQGTYQFITDFEWYITVLIELTHVPTTNHGKLISSQLMDVIVRVKVVRPFGVRNMETMLKDSRLLNEGLNKNSLAEVLYAAAWICGEFNQYLDNHKETIESLLQPRATQLGGLQHRGVVESELMTDRFPRCNYERGT